MKKTIFQKIVDREIPAAIVYEDEQFLSFLDISPVTKGHLLLITKEPYPWVDMVPDTELAGIILKSKSLISALKQSLNADYVQVSIVGTEVPHFHIHLIPRTFGDHPTRMTVDHAYNEGEMAMFAEKIKAALA